MTFNFCLWIFVFWLLSFVCWLLIFNLTFCGSIMAKRDLKGVIIFFYSIDFLFPAPHFRQRFCRGRTYVAWPYTVTVCIARYVSFRPKHSSGERGATAMRRSEKSDISLSRSYSFYPRAPKSEKLKVKNKKLQILWGLALYFLITCIGTE